VAARIAWALDLVEGCTIEDGIDKVFDCIGTGVISQESVPAAFAVLKLAEGDAWKAAVIAANLGGDTDTIGAIAGAMAGACAGYDSLPKERIAGLVGIDLDKVGTIAHALVEARLAGLEGGHG
jgi:ADP-ribosylglycohydrolase